MTASLAHGCPWASRDYVSHLGLASGDSCLCFPPVVDLGQVVNVSPTRGWPQPSRGCVSRLGLASSES
jgi:hypothetical protein